jgi:cytochrome c-type biogenesis protein CcmH
MTETVETSKISRVLLFGALVIFIIAIAIGASRNFGSASEPTAATGPNDIDINAAGPDAVIASLEERTRKDPTDVEAWQLLGWSYFENGRYLDSANAYGKATKLEPARAVYWSSLGESLVMADERNPMAKATLSGQSSKLEKFTKLMLQKAWQAHKRNGQATYRGS